MCDCVRVFVALDSTENRILLLFAGIVVTCSDTAQLVPSLLSSDSGSDSQNQQHLQIQAYPTRILMFQKRQKCILIQSDDLVILKEIKLALGSAQKPSRLNCSTGHTHSSRAGVGSGDVNLDVLTSMYCFLGREHQSNGTPSPRKYCY